MTGRRAVFIAALMLATVVALHPPWTAHAVLSRMDYDGFPAVPPRMVSDTATWKVPFAPVYSPPTLDLKTDELAGYQRRLNVGDTSAATDWQRRVEATERRYQVPEKLRSVWIRGASSGSAAGFAFRRTIVSSRFEVDRAGFVLRLLATTAIVFIPVLFMWSRSRRPSRRFFA